MTYSMLVYFMFALYYLPQREESLPQEKEYNWAISYQIKKRICFSIYKSTYSDNIA